MVGFGCIALVIYWSAVLYHIARNTMTVPTARRGLALAVPDPAPKVCILVPAHNEEACIGLVAASLCGQEYPRDRLRLVFVLDRCTDRTREALDEAVAKAGGKDLMEVVELTACAPGFAGKVHALHVGSQTDSARQAEVLLFVDADTVLDPRLTRAAIALVAERGLGMLSLHSSLTHDTWFERLVQPPAVMELLRQYPLVRANATGARRRAFANGQFILLTRAAYDKIGGHEAVKSAVLEDLELARRAQWNDIPAGLLSSAGLLTCRMYDSMAAMEKGWKRIYIESANLKPGRLRKAAVAAVCTGAVLPAVGIAGVVAGVMVGGTWVPVGVAGGLGLVVWAAALVWVYAAARAPVWCVPGYVPGSLLVARILWRAAADLRARRPTEWGGMSYSREARG